MQAYFRLKTLIVFHVKHFVFGFLFEIIGLLILDGLKKNIFQMMKYLFVILLLPLYLLASELSPAPQEVRYRSSFYFNTSFGLGADIQHYEYDSFGGGYDAQFDYVGFAKSFDIRFGCLIKQLVAVYGMVAYSTSSGNFEGFSGKKEFSDVSGDVRYLGFGSGASFYPWRNPESSMNGIYFGLNWQMGINRNDVDYAITGGEYYNYGIYEMDQTDLAFSLNFELGKEWLVSQRLYLGTALKLNVRGIAVSCDIVDECEQTNYSITAAVTFTRK